FERGAHISFANCGLPYHIGGAIDERDKLLLQTPESFHNRFNVDVRILNEVIAIDTGNKTVKVRNLKENSEYTEAYNYLVLSTGAAPVHPNISGINNPLTYSLRNLGDMDDIISVIDTNRPEHATVIGGGYIGLEMMEALHNRGINVTLVEQASHVMRTLDEEMAEVIHTEIRGMGVDLQLNTALQSIRYITSRAAVSQNDGKDLDESNRCGYLELATDKNRKTRTELLIVAIGVRPEIDLAQSAGLEIGTLGGIVVDSQMRTSDPVIFAVGDAVEVRNFTSDRSALIPLAGPATRQGRIAAGVIFGEQGEYCKTQGTAICKVFGLSVASTGMSEAALKNEELEYEKVYVHAANHASYYPGAETVSLKVLFSQDSGKILGAQATGRDGVDKCIDVLAVSQRAGMTVEDLQHLELCYAPPYGSARDIVNQAGFIATNILKGSHRPIHHHQLQQLTNSHVLLDVRTPEEIQTLGTIPGAINIPIDVLRSKVDELPKDKEIIVFCQVGLRGYVASRLLNNRGYNTRNLIGGYLTWTNTQ
ncbi:MAG TPA: CoA-disulfide reductase, partial [Gammaproteobacteria bacterium]|nr:CoA-disulfide reductase [Gammaproteobacteria bacterium]